jgi:hypothetical protein
VNRADRRAAKRHRNRSVSLLGRDERWHTYDLWLFRSAAAELERSLGRSRAELADVERELRARLAEERGRADAV